jgi:hypothetical protein
LLGDDQRQAAFDAIRDKRYLTEEELKRFEVGIGKGVVKGTVAACPVGSLSWNQTLVKQEGGYISGVEPGTSFVYIAQFSYLRRLMVKERKRR